MTNQSKGLSHRKGKALFLYFIIFVGFISLLIACNNFTPLETPQETHFELQNAWKQSWHAIWELTWDESPLSSPLVFEGWVTENREQQRFEILETTNPKLIGLTYINNGNQAVQYNYFDGEITASFNTKTFAFSPVTDVFNLIDTVLRQSPQMVEGDNLAEETAIVRLRLTYEDNQSLTIWLEQATQHIIRLELESETANLILAARKIERLERIHSGLFAITD